MPTWIELFKCVPDPPHHWRPPDVNNRQLLLANVGSNNLSLFQILETEM